MYLFGIMKFIQQILVAIETKTEKVAQYLKNTIDKEEEDESPL